MGNISERTLEECWSTLQRVSWTLSPFKIPLLFLLVAQLPATSRYYFFSSLSFHSFHLFVNFFFFSLVNSYTHKARRDSLSRIQLIFSFLFSSFSIHTCNYNYNKISRTLYRLRLRNRFLSGEIFSHDNSHESFISFFFFSPPPVSSSLFFSSPRFSDAGEADESRDPRIGIIFFYPPSPIPFFCSLHLSQLQHALRACMRFFSRRYLFTHLFTYSLYIFNIKKPLQC